MKLLRRYIRMARLSWYCQTHGYKTLWGEYCQCGAPMLQREGHGERICANDLFLRELNQ